MVYTIAGLNFRGLSLLLITLLQLPFQLAEGRKLATLEFWEPAFADLMDRDRIDVMPLLAAVPQRGDEVGRFEDSKVLCHRLPRYREAGAEFVQRLSVAGMKPVEQRSPRGVGKRLEDLIHGLNNRQ